ncbi:MAG: ImmA/IrrE family metallo-endopeptidase [Chloroflexota bacterium]|nr:ImmA/IrrE family metallo-endopeptidase [Chloroflexota bacterium]
MIDELNYDWDAFEIHDFVRAVADKVQRAICVVPTLCAVEIAAVWVRTARYDFIFVRQTASPVLQTHSILHELGHIALGHHGYTMNDAQPNAVVKAIAASKSRIEDTPEEAQAERFAIEVSTKVQQARRAHLMATTAIPGLRPYIESGL